MFQAERYPASRKWQVNQFTTILIYTDIHKGIQKDGQASCSCMEKLIPLEKEKATFDNLDPSKKYFLMVAENGKNTFYGISVEMVYPPKYSKPSGLGGLGHGTNPNDDIKIEDTKPHLSEPESLD